MLTFVNEIPKKAKRVELTQEQKQEWFNKVKNASNWKNPIKKTVVLEDESQINQVIESVSHFVGGMTDFEVIKVTPHYTVRFFNRGYYNNIGA